MYVDDILIFGTNIDLINEVKSFLSKSFDMKDLGNRTGERERVKVIGCSSLRGGGGELGTLKT